MAKVVTLDMGETGLQSRPSLWTWVKPGCNQGRHSGHRQGRHSGHNCGWVKPGPSLRPWVQPRC
ncbi:unnamed protein product [Prunus armeniaca]